MKEIKYADWLAEGEVLFRENRDDWKFVCPNCGNVQSMKDFKEAGIEDPSNKVFFSCIGRWVKSEGTIGNGESPCNYTLGGLFDLGTVKLIHRTLFAFIVFDFMRGKE